MVSRRPTVRFSCPEAFSQLPFPRQNNMDGHYDMLEDRGLEAWHRWDKGLRGLVTSWASMGLFGFLDHPAYPFKGAGSKGVNYPLVNQWVSHFIGPPFPGRHQAHR